MFSISTMMSTFAFIASLASLPGGQNFTQDFSCSNHQKICGLTEEVYQCPVLTQEEGEIPWKSPLEPSGFLNGEAVLDHIVDPESFQKFIENFQKAAEEWRDEIKLIEAITGKPVTWLTRIAMVGLFIYRKIVNENALHFGKQVCYVSTTSAMFVALDLELCTGSLIVSLMISCAMIAFFPSLSFGKGPQPKPRPRPRPRRSAAPEPTEVLPEAVDRAIQDGARVLPSQALERDKILSYLASNYTDKTVICRVMGKIYIYDGTNFAVSPLGDDSRFENCSDLTESALSAQCKALEVGLIGANDSVEVIHEGTVVDDVIKIKVHWLFSPGGWADLCSFNKRSGTTVCYNCQHSDAGANIKHSGDRSKDNRNYHWLEADTNGRGNYDPFLVGVVGYRGKKLSEFTDQFNLIELTFSDGSVKYTTCHWNFTPAIIADSRVAGFFSVIPDRNGPWMKVKFHFKSFLKRELYFDTGDCGAKSQEFADKYLKSADRTPTPWTQTSTESSSDGAVDMTNVPTRPSPWVATDNLRQVPGPLREMFKGSLDLVSPCINGGNIGVSNLSFPGGPVVGGDKAIVVYIDNPEEIGQAYMNLSKSRRCVLVLKVSGGIKEINNVCLYACHLMTPQSTLVIFDDQVDKFYHVSGPCPSKEEEDDSIDIKCLIDFHMKNPLNYPLLPDGKIYTDDGQKLSPTEMISEIHKFLDYIDQLQMCVSSDKWGDVFKSMLVQIDTHKKEFRKDAATLQYRILELELKKKLKKKLKKGEAEDLKTLKNKLGILSEKLKGIKDISRHILKFQCHILASKTFGSTKKLSGDVQGTLRTAACSDLKELILKILSDMGRYSEFLGDFVEELCSEYIFFGDHQLCLYDDITTAVCMEQEGHPTIGAILPNIHGVRLIPCPVFTADFMREADLMTMFQESHQVYIYLAMLSASFAKAGQNAFEEEPLYAMIEFLMEKHTTLSESLSSSYVPDPENTTTRILASIEFLIEATLKGFRAGQLNPEVARYFTKFASEKLKGIIPKSRNNFAKVNTELVFQIHRMLHNSRSKNSSFMVTLLGDLVKMFRDNLVAPIEGELKAFKAEQKKESDSVKMEKDNIFLKFQLFLYLKWLWPGLDESKLSKILFDTTEVPVYTPEKSTKYPGVLEVNGESYKPDKHFSKSTLWLYYLVYDESELTKQVKKHVSMIFSRRIVQFSLNCKEPMSKDKVANELQEPGLSEKDFKGKFQEILMEILDFGNTGIPGKKNGDGSNSAPTFVFQIPPTPPPGEGSLIDWDSLKLLVQSSSEDSGPKTSASPEAGAKPEETVSVLEITTPHGELVAAGMHEKLAIKFLETDVCSCVPAGVLSNLSSLGITGEMLKEICRQTFIHWENTDPGVQNVIRIAIEAGIVG